MADYTYSEIMKMQNDAIKRVEDMQKKARKTAGLEKEKEEKAQSNVPVQKPERVPMPNDYLEKLKDYATNSSHTQKENEAGNQPPKSFVPQNAGNSGFLGDFNMDEDKALLLSLIMLLSEEKGDELLIMALIYMLT